MKNRIVKVVLSITLSITILFSCFIPAFAVAENTVNNNIIACLYLFTKSTYGLTTWGDVDKQALHEGLNFVERLEKQNFVDYKFADMKNGYIKVKKQKEYANRLLNYGKKFNKDKYKLKDKVVTVKLPQKVGWALQVMTEIFIRINGGWTGEVNDDVDYSSVPELYRSAEYGTDSNVLIPCFPYDKKKGYDIPISVYKHFFQYPMQFSYYDEDNVLTRIGNWEVEKDKYEYELENGKKIDKEYVKKVI